MFKKCNISLNRQKNLVEEPQLRVSVLLVGQFQVVLKVKDS